MKLKELNNNYDIYNLLMDFEDCFPHLKEKVDNLQSFSNKLNQYANVIVLQKDGKNIAMSAFYSNDVIDFTGYITLIGVKSDYRGLNIGNRIMNETILIMKKCGMKKVCLEVDNDNVQALGFYKHIGFKEIGFKSENSLYLEKDI